MTPPMFALYVTCLLLGRMADLAALKLSSSLHFVLVSGENVTLECFFEDSLAVMFYWYKQTAGQRPQLLSKFYKHNTDYTLNGKFKDDPRFSLEATKGKNHLKILNVQVSDSATYYCVSGYSYKFEFVEGAIVSVKGSGSNIPALVHQSASETVQPGGSVTLNCTVHTGTCDGEHSVYWFKNSDESHPGLIYTHGGRNDQCEKELDTQTHSCVYNLPMKSLNLSHAGTYYCAVATCGHILFGNEKKLDSKHEVHSFVLVYFLIGALAFTTTLVVLLGYAAYTMTYRDSKCTDSRSSAALTPNAVDCQDSDNLHYAALRVHKVNRSTRQRDNTQSECVYSSVKQ